MPRTLDWTLPGADGQTIYGTTHLPDDPPRGALVVCHGFKGYKDYGLLPHLADAAARRGLVAHRFNFSHSGVTPNADTFERPDLFERDTWGRQLADLDAVARAAAEGRLAGGAGAALPQVWFGHSRGGVTALVAAGHAFAEPAPRAVTPVGVVAAAAPHTADRLGDDDKARLRKLGRLESPSARTGQALHVGLDWLTELEADPQRYNPMRQIERLRCPVLLVHGDNDGTVNAMSARLLRTASRGRAELRLIAGATHTFNAPNPLPASAKPPAETAALIDATLAFADRCIAAHRA